MAEKTYLVSLTNTQRGLLRMLVIQEARRLGYGTQFHGDDEGTERFKIWPSRLRKLKSIAGKLMP